MAFSDSTFNLCFFIGRFGPAMIAFAAMLSEDRHARRLAEKRHQGDIEFFESSEETEAPITGAESKGEAASPAAVIYRQPTSRSRARRSWALESFHELNAFTLGIVTVIAILVAYVEAFEVEGLGVYVQAINLCLMLLAIMVIFISERVQSALLEDGVEGPEEEV